MQCSWQILQLQFDLFQCYNEYFLARNVVKDDADSLPRPRPTLTMPRYTVTVALKPSTAAVVRSITAT